VEELKVPKRRVPVEILQPGGIVRHVSVFLAEAAASHSGPERLSDLLNGADEFVPAFDEEAQVMTFLNRRSVALARVAREIEADPEEQLTIPVEQEVEITLDGGTRVLGVVSYVRPGSGRFLDFLNERTPYFHLVERDGSALVSRNHVARVALAGR